MWNVECGMLPIVVATNGCTGVHPYMGGVIIMNATKASGINPS